MPLAPLFAASIQFCNREAKTGASNERACAKMFDHISLARRCRMSAMPAEYARRPPADWRSGRRYALIHGSARTVGRGLHLPCRRGNVMYLASVGVIAAAIVGVFFGTGLLFARPSAGGRSSAPQRIRGQSGPSPATRPSPAPPVAGTSAAQYSSVRAAVDVATGSSPMPRASSGTSAAGHRTAIPLRDRAAAAAPPATVTPISRSPRSDPPLRGRDYRAAGARGRPSAHRRRRFGAPVLRARRRCRGRAGSTAPRRDLRSGFPRPRRPAQDKGDAAEARSWYSRALDLGAAEAKRQLNGLETKQGR